MVLEDITAANAHALFLCPQQSLGPLLVFHQETQGFTHGKELLRHLDDCLSDEHTTEEGGLY